MEFHEKLQELRKQRGLTQEELASFLYVSRTAVSKWESGRGYPNIDSLKAIAKFFSVTIDELLSCDEVLTLAEEDQKEKQDHLHNLIFGLLDVSTAAFFFLPFFGQRSGELIRSVSLLSLTDLAPYLKTAYFLATVFMTLWGALTLVFRNCRNALWLRSKRGISLLFNGLAALLFIISSQPYAAAYLFIFLTIKVLIKG